MHARRDTYEFWDAVTLFICIAVMHQSIGRTL